MLVARERSPGAALPALRAMLVVVLAALVAAGCTDDRLSKEEYERRLQDIGASFDAAAQQAFGSVNFTDVASLEQAGGRLREGVSVIDDATDEIEALLPPADVEEVHATFVEGMREFAAGLEAFADAAASGDNSQVQTFAEQARSGQLPGMQKILGAVREFESKGYDLAGD